MYKKTRLGIYPNYDISYSATVKFFSRVKKEFYYKHNGYLPLDHRPGEAQVDLGDCSFIENGEKTYGKYLVLTFSHSNASYVQLVRHKNAESIVEAIKHIFEYLNGVPHTIWFDNDAALVKIVNMENGSIARTLSNTFQRFKLHYEFKEVFMNPERGYEKGRVEESIFHYIIRNHDLKKFREQIEMFHQITDFLNFKYGLNTFELTVTDSYYNMRELVLQKPEVLEYAIKALTRKGQKVELEPIRGGTDGARLSYNGIITPNLGTGGGNYHGKYEYASITDMNKMVEVVIELLKIITE